MQRRYSNPIGLSGCLSVCTYAALPLLFAVTIGIPTVARATDSILPGFHFKYVATDQELSAVLARFARKQRLRLSLDGVVSGRVSGRFDLPPQRFLTLLADRYHFTWSVAGDRLIVVGSTAPAGTLAASPVTGISATADRLTTSIQNDTAAMPFAVQSGAASRSTQISPNLPAQADPALTPLQIWTATPADKTLQNALARWSIAAGWQLLWELPQDYSIEATASINGSFEDAVTVVAHSLQTSDAPISAIFFDGNRVLRIVAKGAQ